MKTFKYIPKMKDESGELVFSGHVSVRPCRYLEKIEIQESLSLKVNSEGKLETDTKLAMEMMKKLYSVVVERVTDVSLKHVRRDEQFDSLEDLERFKEFQDLLNELSQVVIHGPSLGEA